MSSERYKGPFTFCATQRQSPEVSHGSARRWPQQGTVARDRIVYLAINVHLELRGGATRCDAVNGGGLKLTDDVGRRAEAGSCGRELLSDIQREGRGGRDACAFNCRAGAGSGVGCGGGPDMSSPIKSSKRLGWDAVTAAVDALLPPLLAGTLMSSSSKLLSGIDAAL
eukprot:scaffold1534_cov391-Prasinococcus_capsulatus_cf.AAC.1